MALANVPAPLSMIDCPPWFRFTPQCVSLVGRLKEQF
jgi:hypothetical protein